LTKFRMNARFLKGTEEKQLKPEGFI